MTDSYSQVKPENLKPTYLEKRAQQLENLVRQEVEIAKLALQKYEAYMAELAGVREAQGLLVGCTAIAACEPLPFTPPDSGIRAELTTEMVRVA
ncbi:hypothetical protein H7Y63_00510 [Polaromonas sp.]|nr:hypothetical protein [Candidatus Saccharibacteria bacterium]